MAPSNWQPSMESRRRAKTPAERGDEAADHQRRLKAEAAERREAAAAASAAAEPVTPEAKKMPIRR